MTTPEITIITIATFVTMVTAVDKTCSGADYDRVMDHKLECGIFKMVKTNIIECSKLCADNVMCFSTNTYKTDNGTEMCDLIKGSKKSLQHCFVKKEGSVYNEITVGNTL